MDNEMLAREFNDKIQELADERHNGKLYHGFIDWYIEAEFGSRDWVFGDGAGDAGIDAIVWLPGEEPGVAIIQSKFSLKTCQGNVSPKWVSDFVKVVESFRYGGQGFEDFLETVDGKLRSKYRKAYECMALSSAWHTKKKAFRFISTLNCNLSFPWQCDHPDFIVAGSKVLEIYRRYRRDRSPCAKPLKLIVKESISHTDHERSVKSYLFNASLYDFRKYLESNDVARLVARNIRLKVGGSVIGEEIYRTYTRKPCDFWYMHNGLTIVCDSYNYSGQWAVLTNPSVVNGAQTLYAISNAPLTDYKARVTVRVIVRTGSSVSFDDDQWVQAIIQGVNTQNRVKKYDFKSNEPEQLTIQDLFRKEKVFYERKRGDWREVSTQPNFKGYHRVSLPTLGQIMMCVSAVDGEGVLTIKRGTDAIFDTRHYSAIFPPNAQIRRRFKEYYFAYRLYRILADYGYRSAKDYRKQRHAFWNTLWLLHTALDTIIKTAPSSEQSRIAFDLFEGDSMIGRAFRSRLKQSTKLVWQAFRKARRGDIERWTPNNFFKAAFGNRALLKLTYTKIKQLFNHAKFKAVLRS